jgi:hypothetical protein
VYLERLSIVAERITADAYREVAVHHRDTLADSADISRRAYFELRRR